MESISPIQRDRQFALWRLLDVGIKRELVENLEFCDTDIVKLLYMIERIPRNRLRDLTD